MIKFFRQIRKSLIEKNQMGKYFKYAIGEILLVVIGILIALQINNWNEERKEKEILNSYLYLVLVNLETDLTSIDIYIDITEDFIKKDKSFINHEDYNKFTLDSLEKSIETFYGNSDWISKDGFRQIQNSGIVNYGSYETIINDVFEYYQVTVVNLEISVESSQMKGIEADKYWRYQQNIYEFNYVSGVVSYQSEYERKQAIIRLLKSPIPRNILKLNIRTNQNLLEEMNNVRVHLNDLIPKLKDALGLDPIQKLVEN